MTRSTIGLPSLEQSGIAECLDRLAARKDETRPVATYRLQFNAGFRFSDAQKLLPYLHSLGITHCYASPILQARAGSQHGYDITDHNQINSEIGTEEEFLTLANGLKSLGMGLVLDIVPNHMGVGHGTNPWWHDVLENGMASTYGDYFDIDWRPLKAELHGKVLLPILGDQYGEELEQGKLKIEFGDNGFYCAYYDRHLPIDPQSYPLIFEQIPFAIDERSPSTELAELRSLLQSLREMPEHDRPGGDCVGKRRRELPHLKQKLIELVIRSTEIQAVVEQSLQLLNGIPRNERSFDHLHRLLEVQPYRLAHWRVSAEEINYRRFFDINDLVGLRIENPKVFAATHKLIRKLLATGLIDGLRLDHPDGLFNPVQYLARLQRLYSASQCYGSEPKAPLAENGIEEEVLSVIGQHDWIGARAPLYVLVEKIVEPGEELPQHWQADGTVGYEFGNLLNNLFIDQRNERYFTNLYQRFLGKSLDFDSLVYDSKKLIMRSALASEVTVLTHMVDEISGHDRRARDFTRSSLRDAIREVIACFPVYRTYVDERGNVSDRDRLYIQEAVARAKRRNRTFNPGIFDFIRNILLLDSNAMPPSAEAYRKRLRFTLKLQQLTGPVMAKGLEDTACYIYNRFVSVNEVGGSPIQFGITVEQFHQSNQERARSWPYTMSGTSTHDSKRSEDVRARLNVLSEMPKEWSRQVLRWRRANRSKKRTLGDGRSVPDPNEEYLLYQTLVGTYPFHTSNADERETYSKRIQEYMTKAVHEAKENLSWINQNPEYIDYLNGFIDRILQPGPQSRPNHFLRDLETFGRPIQFFGALNAIAQVLLKITSPGMPDIYRGTELWDFSLVDPDNRRPVDYAIREQMLQQILSQAEDDQARLCAGLLESYTDGRLKLMVSALTLRYRRENSGLFQHGTYVPLKTEGENQSHVIAYLRQQEWKMAITVAPRFSYTLMRGQTQAPMSDIWGDTEIVLPAQASVQFRNIYTGETIQARNSRLLCREVFARFPIALLASV